jgi:hypothetical protein
MLIPYIRSSLLGSYEICELKAFLIYSLGLKEKSGFSADSGTSVHKSLELLAQKKLAQQNGQVSIENEIFDSPFSVDSLDYENAFTLGWEFCKKTMSHHKEWDDEEVKTKYRDMYYKLLSFDNESYNPLKLNIIQPEQYFDIQFQEDWARYEYIIGKEKFEGFLSVKGTMDLVFDNSGYLSGMDYKTGKSRVNWATGKTKYLDDFKEDKQLLLYSYAIKKLFNVDEFSIIIYYLQAGGPFEVYFDNQTFKKAEGMIKDYFHKINSNFKPFLAANSSNPYNKRKCNWCDFNKIRPEVHKSKTVCRTFEDKIINLGMNKVIEKHADVSRVFTYGSGGGRGMDDKASK